jgi:hypothetical protein
MRLWVPPLLLSHVKVPLSSNFFLALQGNGGWPTIRYFNKDTGVDGGSYDKRTSDAMCTELLNLDYIVDYIEQSGLTSLCDVTNGENCDERDLVYLEKMKNDTVKAKAQLDRLSSMEDTSMSEENKMWAFKRKRMLKRLLRDGDIEDETEL